MNSCFDQIQLHFYQGLIFHKNGPIFSQSGVQLILQLAYSIALPIGPISYLFVCDLSPLLPVTVK